MLVEVVRGCKVCQLDFFPFVFKERIKGEILAEF